MAMTVRHRRQRARPDGAALMRYVLFLCLKPLLDAGCGGGAGVLGVGVGTNTGAGLVLRLRFTGGRSHRSGRKIKEEPCMGGHVVGYWCLCAPPPSPAITRAPRLSGRVRHAALVEAGARAGLRQGPRARGSSTPRCSRGSRWCRPTASAWRASSSWASPSSPPAARPAGAAASSSTCGRPTRTRPRPSSARAPPPCPPRRARSCGRGWRRRGSPPPRIKAGEDDE